MISFQVRYDGLASRPGEVAILLGMLHATETGNKLQRRGPLAREREFVFFQSSSRLFQLFNFVEY